LYLSFAFTFMPKVPPAVKLCDCETVWTAPDSLDTFLSGKS
jgi:hypothetical protein